MSGVRHPVFARVYRRLAEAAEGTGLGELRAELVAGLSGTVVEVGPGHGPNFRHYPATVRQVVAVEPEPWLRQRAEQAAAAAPVPVRVVDGLADGLPVADGSADAVVVSLVLCSVHAPRAALAEVHRVLRPGGELRFLEHGQAPPGAARRLQAALDATVWPRLFGGCHTGRDSPALVEELVGITTVRRFRFPDGSRGPDSHFVLGCAVRR